MLTEDWNHLEVGGVVYALKQLTEWNDCHGHCICAEKGDKLIVRGFNQRGDPYFSHEHITDGRSFYLHKDECSTFKHIQY